MSRFRYHALVVLFFSFPVPGNGNVWEQRFGSIFADSNWIAFLVIVDITIAAVILVLLLYLAAFYHSFHLYVVAHWKRLVTKFPENIPAYENLRLGRPYDVYTEDLQDGEISVATYTRNDGSDKMQIFNCLKIRRIIISVHIAIGLRYKVLRNNYWKSISTYNYASSKNLSYFCLYSNLQ